VEFTEGDEPEAEDARGGRGSDVSGEEEEDADLGAADLGAPEDSDGDGFDD